VRRYTNGKLFITPSKQNVGTFLKGIRSIIKDAHGVSAADLIDHINPNLTLEGLRLIHELNKA
jgi:hypothetical protein